MMPDRSAMQPIGPLMIEHRLIERFITVIEDELQALRGGKSPDVSLLREAVDFFRTYADRTHHGKEEDILFRALEKKELTEEQRRMMSELTAEHAHGRELVDRLETAAGEGDVEGITAVLDELIDFYPLHIFKEDRKFFRPVMEHFNEEEQRVMLARMKAFDQGMIHEKYTRLVEVHEEDEQD
jgi:hemerythrin-like domain-containing protein